VSHLDVDLRAWLASLDLLGEAAQEVEMPLEERVVVISSDEVHDRLFRIARDAMGMDVPLAPLGRLG
jgi:hypothetical protein